MSVRLHPDLLLAGDVVEHVDRWFDSGDNDYALVVSNELPDMLANGRLSVVWLGDGTAPHDIPYYLADTLTFSLIAREGEDLT